ncbi:hypothetical protein OROGR_031761 [Orobanche gracilis]
MPDTSSTPTSLKEYLKKYTTSKDKEKKKKKKKKARPDVVGVLVVDEDPIWQKPVKTDEEEEDSADEEEPQVNEDIEVKRMRRLEQLSSRRPFGVISEDGSGWIPISNTPSSITKYEDPTSDISPPRKRRLRNDTPSPGPEQEANIPTGTDLSPPRQFPKPVKRTARFDTPSPESDRLTDLSPPWCSQGDKHSSVPDPGIISSHPKVIDTDISPPRRARTDLRASSAANLSPPKKSKSERSSSIAPSASDLSSPRKRRNELPIFSHHHKPGLVSGRDIKDEIDKTKKEDWLRFNALDPSVNGRAAEPVYRNKKTGERMSKDEFFKARKKELKKDEKPKEIKIEWGEGLVQKREAEARFHEIEVEKNKPFARSRDDPGLDAMLKERVRWGDPMAHLVKKKHLESVLPDLGDSEKMKESGFIVPQEIPSHSWIKRGLEAAPNRYGIKPGRHWDGVDRSNGNEKELFKRTNERKATEREAYLWSVSDM